MARGGLESPPAEQSEATAAGRHFKTCWKMPPPTAINTNGPVPKRYATPARTN